MIQHLPAQCPTPSSSFDLYWRSTPAAAEVFQVFGKNVGDGNFDFIAALG